MSTTLVISENKFKFETVAEFEAWVSKNSILNDKRFEFVNGKIIEKPAMKQEEFFIAKFLSRLFVKTVAYANGDELIVESDSHIDSKRKRVADIGYFTEAQIEAAREGNKFAPALAIEILSPNEKLEDIEEKIQDYFDAGVQLVWYISPKTEQIYTYTSTTDLKIFKGENICHASPVLTDFSFKVKDMFAKKIKK